MGRTQCEWCGQYLHQWTLCGWTTCPEIDDQSNYLLQAMLQYNWKKPSARHLDKVFETEIVILESGWQHTPIDYLSLKESTLASLNKANIYSVELLLSYKLKHLFKQKKIKYESLKDIIKNIRNSYSDDYPLTKSICQHLQKIEK